MKTVIFHWGDPRFPVHDKPSYEERFKDDIKSLPELESEEEEYISEGAGRGWLYVEPDGDVLPSQGFNVVLGNILTDSWMEIWKSNI